MIHLKCAYVLEVLNFSLGTVQNVMTHLELLGFFFHLNALYSPLRRIKPIHVLRKERKERLLTPPSFSAFTNISPLTGESRGFFIIMPRNRLERE